jgi:hypothetical protein
MEIEKIYIRMKIKNLLFAIFLIGSFIQVTGQANFEAKDRERMARNKVKKQVQISYDYSNGKVNSTGYVSKITSYDKNGNAIEIIEMEKSGSISRVVNCSYDSKSNQLEFSTYKGNKEKLTYSQKKTYDARGNKKTETEYNGSNVVIKTFAYDANSRLLEIKYTTDNVLTEKRLFKNMGTLSEMSIVNVANVVISKETTIFDGKNNVIEEAKYVQDNVTQKSNYEYDGNGKKVAESQTKLGSLVYRRKYTYSGSNILQITEERNNVRPYTAFLYKYDGDGNCVEEKWTKEPNGDYSKKTHTYNERGLLVQSDCYFASYNFSVMYKYNYDFY